MPERPISTVIAPSYGDWPHGGCPDCNGLEVDCRRCNGTGYLPVCECCDSAEATTKRGIRPVCAACAASIDDDERAITEVTKP